MINLKYLIFFLNNIQQTIYYIIIILSVLILFLKPTKQTIVFNYLIKLLIFILIFSPIANSLLNYYIWRQDPVSKYLLPPHTSVHYIFRYSFQHYFFAPIVAILFALIVLWGIKKLNKKFNDTFFYDEEPYLAALGILVTSWPNCLFYLSLVLLLGILSHVLIIILTVLKDANNSLRKVSRRPNRHGSSERSERENEAERQAVIPAQGKSTASFRVNYLRLSLLYFWLPCALLTLLLSDIINKYLIINQLVI